MEIRYSSRWKNSVGGYSVVTGQHDFVVVRFNSDGPLDTTFGNQGFADASSAGVNLFAENMTVQPDGKIVVCGTATGGGTQGRALALARFNPDGSIDATFGSNGVVVDDGGGDVFSYEVAIAQDNSIYAGGGEQISGFDQPEVFHFTSSEEINSHPSASMGTPSRPS